MTDLESPKKNNDCYFYYYSTCSKGDKCGFRHEPSALGCETMCSFWKEGKCLNIHCNFRHMELRKNRKAIQCYWETQPGGCLKPHCSFMHQNPRPMDSAEGSFKGNPPVDSLVVNFEEESDSESQPIHSPAKNPVPKVKTLEEIKLEKIAALGAAYYAYDDDSPNHSDSDDLRQKILRFRSTRQTNERKLTPSELARILQDNSLNKRDSSHLGTSPSSKKPKVEIKIKTLEEIRAERRKTDVKGEESEVSSTSNDEEKVALPMRKLNLAKIIPKVEEVKVDDGKLDESLLLIDDDVDMEDEKPEEELFQQIDHLLDN